MNFTQKIGSVLASVALAGGTLLIASTPAQAAPSTQPLTTATTSAQELGQENFAWEWQCNWWRNAYESWGYNTYECHWIDGGWLNNWRFFYDQK